MTAASSVSERWCLPTKFCKYELFGVCKAIKCQHTHDIKVCSTLSIRKMNASNADIDRILQIIRDNTQIRHLNFGRNRVSRKHCNEIAELLIDQKRRIESVCLDSTCLGRHGFVTIMNAAAKSIHLRYLDVADANFIPSAESPNSRSRKQKKKKRRKSQTSPNEESMMRYHRQEVVDSIVSFLESPKVPIEHLIIGWNQLNAEECKTIADAAGKRGLITLDLHGNEMGQEEMACIHDVMFVERMSVSAQALKHCGYIDEIAGLIVQWAIDSNQSKYRCYRWSPRQNR